MLSPNAISEAAVAEAIKGCKRQIDFIDSNDATGVAKNISTDGCNQEINKHSASQSNKKLRISDRSLSIDPSTSNDQSYNSDETTAKDDDDDDDDDDDRTKQKASGMGNSASMSIQKAIEQIHQIWMSEKQNENSDSNDEIEDTESSSYENYDNEISTTTISSISSKNKSKIDQTKRVIFNQFEMIIQLGMEAFHKNDTLNRELIQSKETNESQKREIERLKVSEDDSRASLSNLLQAVEASKSNARDNSRAAQTEARLRGEISSIRYERDVALGTNAELKRKSDLLEEEVGLLKSRVGRLTQDKIKIERESRVALGLARSMDSHVASDVDFYRRKVADLNDHLQSKNKVITDLKEEIESYKRDMERSLSQNRLAQIRKSGGRKR